MIESFTIFETWDVKKKVSLCNWKDLDHLTPCIVKATGDDPGSSHLPDKLVEEQLYLHSVVNHKKAICQCVDFVTKDGQIYFSDQRFSIPMGYVGWFEILSENGKTVAPCKTIEEVYEKNAEKFLVRSKVKAYLSQGNGDPDYDKSRIVLKGEVLTVVAQFTVAYGWRKQKKKILHCLDAGHHNLFLDLKSTGQFSPMAGPANISGVHSIDGLIKQFRLPLTVRIVSGQIPRVASKNARPGLFRLNEVQMDTTALLLPVSSHQKLLPVSTRTGLNLIPCSNMSDICRLPFYKQLQNLADAKVSKYFKTMQVLVSTKPTQKVFNTCTLPARTRINKISRSSASTRDLTEEDILFDEVDDLYAYVRRGGVPPRPRPRSWANNLADRDMNGGDRTRCQPMFSYNGRPRGLLASLTAGKFPAKGGNSLTRPQKANSSCTTKNRNSRAFSIDTGEIPVSRKDDLVRSFIERFKGSEESLLTEVDPYVDEGHYQNFETIERVKKISRHTRHGSLDDILAPKVKHRLNAMSVSIDEGGYGDEPTESQKILAFLQNANNYKQSVQAS